MPIWGISVRFQEVFSGVILVLRERERVMHKNIRPCNVGECLRHVTVHGQKKKQYHGINFTQTTNPEPQLSPFTDTLHSQTKKKKTSTPTVRCNFQKPLQSPLCCMVTFFTLIVLPRTEGERFFSPSGFGSTPSHSDPLFF